MTQQPNNQVIALQKLMALEPYARLLGGSVCYVDATPDQGFRMKDDFEFRMHSFEGETRYDSVVPLFTDIFGDADGIEVKVDDKEFALTKLPYTYFENGKWFNALLYGVTARHRLRLSDSSKFHPTLIVKMP